VSAAARGDGGRVLVTGAGGLLGGRLAALLSGSGFDVTALWRRSPPPPGVASWRADLAPSGAVAAVLDRVRPDAVVHAAAFAHPDLCETAPAEAERVNADLPRRLAEATRARGIRLLALSTDLVFDGSSPFCSPETPARPLGVYGRTKLRGEDAVLEADPGAAVVRVALVLGRGHGSRGTASEAVAWALAAGKALRLFADEYRTPIDPESVADAVARLLGATASGRFHLGGSERLSRHELGMRVARALRLDGALISRGVRVDYPGPDPRPADTSLDSARATRELGWRPRALDDAVLGGRAAAPPA